MTGTSPHEPMQPPARGGALQKVTMARMSGKRALLEQLIADGTCHIFGNPGTTEQGFMDILQDYPAVQFMLALHEGVAVSMADAYARLTRRHASVERQIAVGR